MAFTAFPSVEPLQAAVLEALITEVRPLFAAKTADETITSNAALQNDNHLFVSVEASATYRVELDFVFNSGTTPDIKWTLSLPSGGAGAIIGLAHNVANVVFTFNGSPTSTYSLAGLGAVAFVHVTGYITTSSAGTVQFQWAQNTSDPGNTTVLAGSTLRLTRTA